MVGIVTIVATCCAATTLAAWLVRRFAPEASGSGIPHVEAVLRQKLPPAPFRLIPIKFVGGLLAIGSGLALGREGPSVQMGAGAADLLGKFFRRPLSDRRVLLAAGAGAGLATAFNAPLAGAVFVLEELARRFDTRITIATFGASAGAISVSRVLLGQAPDFTVESFSYPGFGALPMYLALGLLAGILGLAYNRAIVGALDAAGLMRKAPVELRAAVIGAAVGLIAWFAPQLVGGGDALTQSTLDSHIPLASLAILFVVRFALGAVSYAAQTPGGLFAPMLVLGAQSGLFFGVLANRWNPDMAPNPVTFAVVGTAAFFTAVVRAPLTGIILIIELTGQSTLLRPLLAACFAAMVVPTVMRNRPIYDSQLDRRLRSLSR
jgi:CIC family chloride channel protein